MLGMTEIKEARDFREWSLHLTGFCLFRRHNKWHARQPFTDADARMQANNSTVGKLTRASKLPLMHGAKKGLPRTAKQPPLSDEPDF